MDRRTEWRRKNLSPERQKALDFALELDRLSKQSPDSLTASSIRKVINGIRVRFAKSQEEIEQAILKAIGVQEAHTLEEISEDIGLSQEMAFDVIKKLLEEDRIYEKIPMVKTNQARRKIPLVYYYVKR